MRKALYLLALSAVSAVFLSSCSQNSPTAPGGVSAQGQSFSAQGQGAEGGCVLNGLATITKGMFYHTEAINFSGQQGTAVFDAVHLGHWDIYVELSNAQGQVIYAGMGTAVVKPDKVAEVTIEVTDDLDSVNPKPTPPGQGNPPENKTGKLIVHVALPEPCGLILWNKLGSVTEVQNSEIGPDLAVQGGPSFDPCKFDNGVHSPNNETDNVYGDSSVVPLAKGCIEFWWKPMYAWDATGGDKYAAFFGISDWRPAPGPSPDDSNEIVSLFAPSGSNSKLYFVYITKINNSNFSQHILSATPNPFNANDLVHIAVVWDVDKMIAGQYSMAIYQDENLIGGLSEDIVPRNIWCSNLDIAGRGQNDLAGGWDGCKGPVDNIKIWNYPKIDFSDRFVE